MCVYQDNDPPIPISGTLTVNSLLLEFAMHARHLLAAAVHVILTCACIRPVFCVKHKCLVGAGAENT
jgi:hypothetical protein